MKISKEMRDELAFDAQENRDALENKPRNVRYPWDFIKFNGAELPDETIDRMLTELLASERTLSVYTGNTKIKLMSFGDIQIWKHIATYKSKKK